MTPEKAITTLELAISEVEWNYPLDISIALETAIETLKKQIPRKPKVSFQLGFYWCPDCECAIKMKIEKSKKNISYCPFCAQALEGGEDEC